MKNSATRAISQREISESVSRLLDAEIYTSLKSIVGDFVETDQPKQRDSINAELCERDDYDDAGEKCAIS